jgi:hypothetical protein
MTSPYRALCAELVNELTRAANGLSNRTALAAHINDNHRALWAKDAYQAAARARALLAQPEPEGVSADEWDALVERAWDKYKTVGYQGELFMYDSDFGNALDFVRKELAPWGRPTPQPEPAPVPVSERPWERDDWCDALGKVFRMGQ